MIELHFFGRLRGAAGAAYLAVELQAGDDIAALVARVEDPVLAAELRRPDVRVVRDGSVVTPNHTAAGASEILFFPPVSGG